MRGSRARPATTLWNAYKQRGDEHARGQLLAQHLPLVYHVARQILKRLSTHVEMGDLVNAGTMGLINAIETFEPARGLAFSTFAAPRIRGAILDDLRRSDHVPRSIRRKQRQIAGAQNALSTSLDRRPDDRETAEHLGIAVETLWRWKADAEESIQISIDQPVARADGGAATPAELIEGDSGEDVELRVNAAQEIGVLRDEILRLKERERVVLTLYYFEELKLREIAEVLGLTESRISQIRTAALQTLRERMGRLRAAGV